MTSDWDSEVEEIQTRRELAKQMGGPESVEKQHEKGRLAIRERIDKIVDQDAFQETGPGAGFAEKDADGRITDFSPANYVLGQAKIDGRPVVIGGEDFTLKGGSPNAAGLRKSVYAEQLALTYDVPLIRLLEGGGGSVAGSKGGGQPTTVGDPVFTTPRFKSIADVMGRVPVVSAALGPVAGFPAARLAASHFSVMVRKTSQVLIAGPQVVNRALNENVTKEELGGYKVHQKSGVVDNVAKSEEEALDQIKAFLSYMPTNVDQLPPIVTNGDTPDRTDEELLTIVPKSRRQPFEMRTIIKRVCDKESYFEMASKYGPGIIVGLARLNGLPVGILGNDCKFYAGAMSAEGSQKARRFIDMCNQFHLPIVSFVDEPGFMIGSASERAGTIRYGTGAVMAAVQSVVPWASVIVRKVFGVAGAAHFGPDAYTLAWPSAETGALPVEGGVAVAFGREIAAAEDPDTKRRELEEMLAARQSPFPRGESFSFHDVIDPRETRPLLCQWADWQQLRLEKLKGEHRFTFRP